MRDEDCAVLRSILVPLLAAFLIAAPSKPAPKPAPAPPAEKQHHIWNCVTKLKKVEKKGPVCAVDEEAAIDLCGVELCELDLECNRACHCAHTAEACTP